MFEEPKKTEIYIKDFKSNEIINYYRELYQSNPRRKSLNHNQLTMKISEIINISCRLMLKEDERIYPPRSTSKNFNGFSQKTIEEIIRDKSLEMEFKKLNFLLQVIC